MAFWKKENLLVTTDPISPRPDSWFERFTSHAAFTGVTTLVIVLTGAAASLFTEGIRKTSSVVPAADSSSGSVIFWLLLVVAVLLLYANQKGLFRKSDGAHHELATALARLDSAVKRLNTLPSENFLPSYKDQYAEALAATALVLLEPQVTVDNVESAIRAVLAALVDTAKDYDNAESGTAYAANVMLFRRKEHATSVNGIVDLVPIVHDSPDYIGVLELIPELSVSSASSGARDPHTGPISVPIPADPSDYFDHTTKVNRSAVMPGAPTSYVTGSFDAFASIATFLSRLEDTSIDRKQVEVIRKYFLEGKGRHIRSFVSLPILPLGLPVNGERKVEEPGTEEVLLRSIPVDRGAPEPLGVLNLQSQNPGLLADNGEQLFAPLMSTFAALIAILIVQRQDLLAKMRPELTDVSSP